MANKMIKTASSGIAHIFARFTRTTRNKRPDRGSRWYDSDISSRGL
jgi:hypothetical protein